MRRKSKKQKELIKRVIVYAVMAVSVCVLVTFVFLFVLGFRFDADKGSMEQYAIMQFASNPSGATVTINGKVIGSKTSSKSSVTAGKYDVVMWRDGYETWTKTVDVKAGTLNWLNYALLVPKVLAIEPVANYASVYSSLSSPEGRSMLIQERAEAAVYDLVDLSADTIKSTKLTIPTNIYSGSTVIGMNHVFQFEKWDEAGRYVLIKHIFGEKNEILVMDTQNVALSKNITRLFDIPISDINFSGTSGNVFYVLEQNDIRKLDISAQTISRPLVSNVKSFSINKTNIISYIGLDAADANIQILGLYRDGDSEPRVIRTVTGNSNLLIAFARYFNENYVAITNGKNIDILSGSYPSSASDSTTSMKVIASVVAEKDIQNLMFSPTGEYVFIQSGTYFGSYDLEQQTLLASTIEGVGDIKPFKWFNENYIWSDFGGNLSIREFDGANAHVINPVSTGMDVALTHNGRFVYSINTSALGYQLQRVRMILP